MCTRRVAQQVGHSTTFNKVIKPTRDTYATFDGMGTPTVIALPAMVKQLLGIDRPAIA
jgi:hypothetical protein